ncbi:MAG: hypothetical protein HFE39_01620 [Clostridiales bacterium]|jgi:hypothetical protein|nr:hypothetical protein [Clostridiales bacterium]
MKKLGKCLLSAMLAVMVSISMVFAQTASDENSIPDELLARHNSVGVVATGTYSKWSLQPDYTGDVELLVNHYSGNVTINTGIHSGNEIGLSSSWNSLDDYQNWIGIGWRLNYERKLTEIEPGVYEYIDETGSLYHFTATNNYIDEMGRELSIENGVPTKITTGRHVTYLDEKGRVREIVAHEPAGERSWVLGWRDWGESDFLDFVVNSKNAGYQFEPRFANNLRLTAKYIAVAPSPDATMDINFHATAKGNTYEITAPDTRITRCLYNAGERYIVAVNNARITYDDAGRATEVTIIQDDGTTEQVYKFIYGNNQTVIIDPTGHMTLEQFNADGTLKN